MNCNKKIAVIDYGMGNIYSIMNAVERSGGEPIKVSSPSGLANVSHAILPGVGAFPEAISRLRELKLDKAVIDFAAKGKPLLGICLGMQLLCDSSTENGDTRGLGILNARVQRFPVTTGYSIPQIQWNQVSRPVESVLLRNIPQNQYFYFLHSYYVSLGNNIQSEATISTSVYCNMVYCSALEHGNVFATQFHPEKSTDAGHQILKNFLSLGD